MTRTSGCRLCLPLAVSLPCFSLAAPLARAAVDQPTPEELSMTSQPQVPGAAAVYLYREETTDDNLHMFSIYVRLKVLTERGKEYANVELDYATSAEGPILRRQHPGQNHPSRRHHNPFHRQALRQTHREDRAASRSWPRSSPCPTSRSAASSNTATISLRRQLLHPSRLVHPVQTLHPQGALSWKPTGKPLMYRR